MPSDYHIGFETTVSIVVIKAENVYRWNWCGAFIYTHTRIDSMAQCNNKKTVNEQNNFRQSA